MSTHAFPPVSNNMVLIEYLLQPYYTMIEDKNAIYISTPMTSGKLYMSAFAALSDDEKGKGLSKETRNQLFKQNCQHAQMVASVARLHHPIVIDPTKVEIKGWNQDDYLTFWHKVIVDCSRFIQFVDNWYYSNGCAYEFLVGAIHNKTMIDERDNIIDIPHGVELIKSAYYQQLQSGFNNTFLLSVIKALDDFILNKDNLCHS